jgi:hypothetical protein
LKEDERVQEQGSDGDILPKREEVTGDWDPLHNEERNCYSLLNILRVFKHGGVRGVVWHALERREMYTALR